MPSRKTDDLCPVVQGMYKTFLEVCKQKGIEIILTSTLRTESEQIAYYAQGRKSLDSVNHFRRMAGMESILMKENSRTVTDTITSAHQFGCGFDVAIIKKGLVIWEIKADVNENDIPDYEEIGQIGEAIGLKWGGRFKKKDYVHFEYTGGLTLADLEAGKRPHEGGVNV
jgi:peptidoglycan L-alanyl-D-glutamate endopeptidase CwlK